MKSYRKSCKATFFTPAHEFPTSINIRLFHSCLAVFNADLPCHAQLVSGNPTELFTEGGAPQNRRLGCCELTVSHCDLSYRYQKELCCCLGHDTSLTYVKQEYISFLSQSNYILLLLSVTTNVVCEIHPHPIHQYKMLSLCVL